MSEQTAPYGAGAPSQAPRRRTRIVHLLEAKQRGERWAMLTAYDRASAAIFEEAGIPVLLVGDSAANNALGYDTTLPVTTDELLPLVRAVVRGAPNTLIVADLPFGSYEVSPQQALKTAVRFMKEGQAHAVKLEGGVEMAPVIEAITAAGIPVMAHIGFTPQSEHALGGYRVQGRGEEKAQELLRSAHAVQEAGAFAVVLEMVPAPIAAQVTAELTIPTVGIGAGVGCDAQVLVWYDFAGLNDRKMPRFVKQYADLHGTLLAAAREYKSEVEAGTFPGPEHSFDS